MASSHSRSQDVASTLRTEILRNQYRVGERLPSERDLSARFATNRGAVREALKQLEQLGIISIQPGGARVLAKEEATLEILGHILNLDDYPDPKLLDQFLIVFKVFSVMSAESAIENADAEQIAHIETLLANLKASMNDNEAMRETWGELFDYFYVINDNLVMRLVANGLKVQLLERMTGIEIKPQLDSAALAKIVTTLQRAVKQQDSVQLGQGVAQYFELIRKMVATALAHFDRPEQASIANQR